MKKAILVLSLAAFAALGAEWTGHISDSKCGAMHSDHSEKSINCVKGCVKAGQKPVFVTKDGKVLQISNPDKVMKVLGHQVKVTGKLEGDTLTIDSVENLAPTD